MIQDLYPNIFKRKSFHTFKNIEDGHISEEEIQDIYKTYNTLMPLIPNIKTEVRIVSAEKTTCTRGEEYCILLYSEQKPAYLQNIGYIGEQLDLYLVSQNIGTLWFGIGRPDMETYNDMQFVIMIAIHKINDETKFRKDMFKSKRKEIAEIWKGEEISGITDIVRFAPSACNTQPWFVENNGDIFVYRYKKQGKRGIMPTNKVSYYNQIDIGIFLCFMDLCLEHSKIDYETRLYMDDGQNKELTLNAIYTIKKYRI